MPEDKPSNLYCNRLGAGCLSSKSQGYVPTGISSLDSILNNGYPLGAVILIEEDERHIYSDTVVKYFLAEGIANNDIIFFGSKDCPPFKLIKELPLPLNKSEEVNKEPLEDLRIAWRYQGNSPIQSSPGANRTSHSHDFNFSSRISDKVLQSASITCWPDYQTPSTYSSLFDKLFDFISTKALWYGYEAKNTNRKNARICINNLGSPFWLPEENIPIYQFLFELRTLVHNSSSVALVTIPTYLFNRKVISRCEQASDIVISLSSLADSTNKQYSEYSGLMKFLKISSINSLSAHVPEDSDWAFKVKKKKLIIEKLHLPPESSITDQREQDDLACAVKLF